MVSLVFDEGVRVMYLWHLMALRPGHASPRPFRRGAGPCSRPDRILGESRHLEWSVRERTGTAIQ